MVRPTRTLRLILVSIILGAAAIAMGQQPVSIRLWHILDATTNPSAYKWRGQLLIDFANKYPNITVDEQIIPNADWNVKIQTATASGLEPDVFSVRGGRGWLDPFIKENVLLPLDKYLDSKGWRSTFVDGFLQAFVFSNKTYAVPVQVRSHKIWYNRALFDKYGLTVPKTYTELKNIITKLTQNGIIPFALGNKGGWMIADWLFTGIQDRIGGPEPIRKARERIPPGFRDPSFVRTATVIKELADMGAFPPGFNGISFTEAAVLFYQGQAAMNYFIDLFPDMVAANAPKDFQLDFFEMPAFEGGKGDPRGIQGNIGMGLGISSRSKHPDEAALLLQWWTAPDNIRKLTQLSGWVTAIKGTINPDDVKPLTLRVYRSMQTAPFTTVTYSDDFVADWREFFWNDVSALAAGKLTPQELVDRLEKKAVEVYGK
jgi:raffinose/stachyose/melibiose transport system substrate-binding protein